MKSVTNSAIKGLIALAVTIAGPLALAQDTGWYGGANLGQTRANTDDDRINSNLLGQGFPSVIIEDEDRDFGYKLFGGYPLGRYFAVDGGYFNLGDFGYTAEMIPAGTLDSEVKIHGPDLDLAGLLPVTEDFSAFVRAGVNHAKVKGTFMGTGLANVTTLTTSDRETNHKFGLGLRYFLSEGFGNRAETERNCIDDSPGTRRDVDLFSVDLVYHFGADSSPAAYSPEPVAEADTIKVIVLVVTQRQEYCNILDVQFDTNQATVKPQYRGELHKVANFL